MPISIEGETFEGPYRFPSTLDDKPGVYVIATETVKDSWKLLDVGQSDTVKTRVENHDRVDCWNRYKKGDLGYCVKYEPNQERRDALEKKIRTNQDLPCGDR